MRFFFKFYCFLFVHRAAKLILKPKFPIPIIEVLLPDVQTNIGDYAVEENITHDIMIVASDDDYQFVVHNLIPFSISDLGYSLLFPQNDINGGQSNI